MKPAISCVRRHAHAQQHFIYRTPAQTRLYLLQHIVAKRPHSLKERCRHISRGIFDAFLGKGSVDDQDWEGPIFEPIDPDSDGGLGGTSEELFGPLVITKPQKKIPLRQVLPEVIILPALRHF